MAKAKQVDPRQVQYVPLAALEPDARNPKAHDEETINQSINRFGVLDLIVRDERTGKIVSGHGRRKALLAMYEAGETPPEGVQVDEDGVWLVPVVTGWASRSDTEASAALIALNRTTELGGWVDESLLDLLNDLTEMGDEGLVGVGFDQAEIDALAAFVDTVLDEPDYMDDAEFDRMVGDEDTGITLTITGLTNNDVSTFRSLPGGDDVERLRNLLGTAVVEGEVDTDGS